MDFDMRLVSGGAALGSVVPGLGTAIGAGVGGLAALAKSLWPETVGDLLDGPRAAEAAPLFAEAIERATGASDPGAVTALLAANPALSDDLRGKLAETALALERVAAADRQDARKQSVDLARAGNPLAWGPAFVTFVVLAMFAAFTGTLILRGIPPGIETLVIRVETILETLVTAAVFYWVGSSTGSARKDERLAARDGG